MAHKFEPADEKYWEDQRRKRQAAIQRQNQERASNTNFTDLFSEDTLVQSQNQNKPQQ